MNTTDQLLIHLIRAVHTNTAVAIITSGKMCEDDPVALNVNLHYTTVAQDEADEFNAFIDALE